MPLHALGDRPEGSSGLLGRVKYPRPLLPAVYERRGHPLAAALAVTLVAVLLVYLLFFYPIPHDFAGSVVTLEVAPSVYRGFQNESFPAGAGVSVHWKSAAGVPLAFSVFPFVPGEPATGCDITDATGGSCSFTSSGGTYVFEVTDIPGAFETSETGNFTGTYTVPLL